jgi:hypothetical protein
MLCRSSEGPACREGTLHDASTDLDPGTLASKLSRCKEGMAHFLPSRYQVLWPLRVSRYKVYREQVTSQGKQCFITGNGAVVV